MLDGENNSVVETETVAETLGEHNPNSNGFYPVSRIFKTEKEALRNLDLKRSVLGKLLIKTHLTE